MSAKEIAEQIRDPELPVLTLADLGVLRSVEEHADRVVVTITPTYSGCPAIPEMGDDLKQALIAAGYRNVEVKLALSPAWTTDWITDTGRQKLHQAGIAPPGPRTQHTGPIPLNLAPPSQRVLCPQCGSPRTSELSHFGSTACKALWRCQDCAEPFEYFKER